MAAFLSSQERKQIVSAITQAELNTSGEIRVHVETYCPSSSLERAIFVFNQLKMYKTKERNSVLIYFATESRKFAVIGDTGINEVVPEDFWESVKETMRNSFMDGCFVDGICKGVKEIGQKLKAFFPISNDDVNELSNEISIGE